MQTREAAAQRQQLVASESAKPLGPALRIPPRPVGGVLLFADRRKKKLPEGRGGFLSSAGGRNINGSYKLRKLNCALKHAPSHDQDTDISKQ